MDRELQKRYKHCAFAPTHHHAKEYQAYLDAFEASVLPGREHAPRSYKDFCAEARAAEYAKTAPRIKVNTYNRFAKAYGQDGFAHMSFNEHAALMKQHGDIPDEYRERERLSWRK
jgi:hypothetical protein